LFKAYVNNVGQIVRFESNIFLPMNIMGSSY